MCRPRMPKATLKNLVLLYFAKNFFKSLNKKLAKEGPKKKYNKLPILQ